MVECCRKLRRRKKTKEDDYDGGVVSGKVRLRPYGNTHPL